MYDGVVSAAALGDVVESDYWRAVVGAGYGLALGIWAFVVLFLCVGYVGVLSTLLWVAVGCGWWLYVLVTC